MRRIKKFTRRMLTCANIAVIVLMLFTGYAYLFDPVAHPYLSVSALFFPVFLALNLCFLVFWVLFKLRYASLPVLGLLLAYHPVRLYAPLNIQSKVPADAIKVLSYNVQSFGYDVGEVKRDETNAVIRYIGASKADIVCLQEADAFRVNGELDSVMRTRYKYQYEEMKDSSGNILRFYTNFPIVEAGRIEYPSYGNMSLYCHLKIGSDTVLVVNNHFETNNLSRADKKGFKDIVEGKLRKGKMKRESNLLISKLAFAAYKRAPQADAVADYIARYPHRPVIVCGDFNESPNGYARNKVGKGLTDAYVAAANGPGWSYHRSGMYVRIDNILCSKDFEVYAAKVDASIGNSDHYPVYCSLRKRKSP